MQPEETPPIPPSPEPPTVRPFDLADAEQAPIPDGVDSKEMLQDSKEMLQDSKEMLQDSKEKLQVCFHCAGELAYPLDWSEEGPRHWRILLRCPECESRREGVFEQAAVERLDDELDRATGALLEDLRQMTHANMSEEVEFFVRALDADLIVPSDF